MNVDLGIWDKLRRLVVLLLFLAAVVGVVVWYFPVIQKNERIRKEIRISEDMVRHEEERGRQLKAAIDALRSDPRAIERQARETLGYIKPGETRIRFEPLGSNYPGRP